MIDIVMLSCNRARLTKISIEEITNRTTTPYRLTVMDNGSFDGSPEMLRQLEARGLIDRLVLSEDNFGVHWGFNQLLEIAAVDSYPYYICTDADLIPSVPVDGGDWLDRLITLMDLSPEYGAIACRPHSRMSTSPSLRTAQRSM